MYQKCSTGLIRILVHLQIIITHLKKFRTPGWPSWAADEKESYIQRYLEKDGIRLDPNRIKNNPGWKASSKLMLNSFWSKQDQFSVL
jgi:hypothetical protein